ncbi:TIR domain-containing protein [Massilia sp.]|uniref:TIR domain-containing protein n=1 Tax=Massilia sp. TaxID=1882437 RepID=UPI00289AEE50|nr:TIR domain-containing protein [Massilia sp.]
MKVFISWSGEISHRVAKVLRDWLPSVIQTVEPYVSSEDIDKGTRWSTDIAGELSASSYGIICLTRDNLAAPWINFEAGALGKSVEKSRVSPFLFDLKRSEISGPILQFQSTIEEKDDVFKLLQSINSACEKDGLDDVRLAKTFEVWWPRLDEELKQIRASLPKVEQKAKELPKQARTESVLEELLELTRNNHKILRDPTSLLPPDYVSSLLLQDRHEERIPSPVLADLQRYTLEARSALEQLRHELITPNSLVDIAIKAVEKLDMPIRYIVKEGHLRRPLAARNRFSLDAGVKN